MSREDTFKLGELIEAVADAVRRSPEARVRFDFVYFHPDGIHSYRGSYDQLALGYSNEGWAPKCVDLLPSLQTADQTVFRGYKGGQFRMTRRTSVWVAQHHEAGCTGIVRTSYDQDELILHTAHLQWMPD